MLFLPLHKLRAAILVAALGLCGIAIGAAQTTPAAPDENEPVVTMGPDITPPVVTHQVSPKPDSGSRGFRVNGVVLVGLIISSKGLPRDVRVVQSLDKELDKNAVDAVQQWRFEPAKRGATPVAIRITVEIRFQNI